MPRLLVLTALLIAFARPASSQPADVAPVIEAERAFAADGWALGLDAALLKWAAEDAIMIAGGAVRRTEARLDPQAPLDPSAPPIAWWPTWAGIARSGDLGFTSGPVEVGGMRRGHYFTVWRRQADGGWKWVYDGGVGASAVSAPGPASEPAVLPTSVLESPSADAAMSEVRTVEAVLAASALRDQKQAHLSLLASDARLHVDRLPPAIGAAQFPAVLDAWPRTLELSPPLDGGASAAGDMVWTYGRVVWDDAASSGAGYYVHLWQKRTRGWMLAFAQIVEDPSPPVYSVAPPPARD